MYKASQSAEVGTINFSVEWRKTCVFALWQACLLGGILLLTGTGFAQLSTASLNGAVRDSSGAILLKAKVVLKNVATGVEHTTTTNDAGAYLFLDINPGNYVLSASAQGFAVQRVPQFTLAVGQAATIDFSLAVGSETSVVEVKGSAPQLDTSGANLGLVVGTKQVNDLPLNGRDFTQLLTLTPGVSPVNNSQSGTAGNNYGEPAPADLFPTNPSVNGAGNRSNYFFADGLSNFGAWHSTYAVPPIIDQIQEFKVVSHADSAEYGSVIGGVINVVTKSGTNQFHGSAFEYGRNGIFDAQDDFTKKAPVFRQNEFGFTAGGPVWIPKLYDGRNKTFFFVGYQGFRYALNQSAVITVPTANELAGDFSGLTNSQGQPIQLYNPFTTTNPAPGVFVRQPYANNQIPVDPNMVAWLKFVYPAGGPGNPQTIQNAVNDSPATQHINQTSVRVDQKIGQNDQAWFRYSRSTSVQSVPAVPGIPSVETVPNRNYGGSYVHVFSPSLIAQFEYGHTVVGDNASNAFTQSTQALISQIGFSPNFVGNFIAAPGRSFLPGISGTVLPTAGEVYALHPNVPLSNQYSGVVTKTIGTHEIHIGGGYISSHFYSPITTDTVTYGPGATADTNPLDTLNTGNALASLLLNVPVGADRRNIVTETRPGGVMSAFVQDSWRATPKLTLNAGLRYDVTLWPTTGTDNLNGVSGGPETGDMDFNNGTYILEKQPPLCSVRGHAPCIPGTGLPANVVVSSNGKILHNNWRNFGPHLGFAYKAMDGLVVRGGFGIVYDNWAGMLQTVDNISGQWPDNGTQEAANLNAPTAANPTPTVTSQNPFGAGSSQLPGATPFQNNIGFYFDPNYKDPYSEQWNFGIQKSVNQSTTLTVNYAGSSMHRLDVGGSYGGAKTPSILNTAANNLYPYAEPTFYDRSVGYGNYNSLQVSLDKRYTSGLSYGVSYTYSKSVDVGGDGYYGVEGGVPQDAYNPGKYDRSVSGLDLTHILSVNTLYEIPVGKGKRFSTGNSVLDYIVGNWQINNILQAHSGIAFTPLASGDIANTGEVSWFPYEHLNKVGNPGVSNPSPSQWFNTAAYVQPTGGTYGDAGRNSLRGPSFLNLDTSIIRKFPIGEGMEFQFQAQAFNVLNHVNWGQPDNIIQDPTFGKITSLAFSSHARQLQLAGKFIF